MFTGTNELFIIVIIIIILFIIPRLSIRPAGRDQIRVVKRPIFLSGQMRVAIVASILWPIGVAVFTEPWNGTWPVFLIIGLTPVIIGWAGRWIIAGYKNRK